MPDKTFHEVVEKIISADSRYAPEAYEFIGNAVSYTAHKLKRLSKVNRHVTGRELLEGIKEFALQEYGPMAGEILAGWGISDSASIGHIVFNMVDNKLLGKTDQDSMEDFREGFDVNEDLSRPFKPQDKNKNPVIIE